MSRVMFFLMLLISIASVSFSADATLPRLPNAPLSSGFAAPPGIDINALLREVGPGQVPSLRKDSKPASAAAVPKGANTFLEPGLGENNVLKKDGQTSAAPVCVDVNGEKIDCPETVGADGKVVPPVKDGTDGQPRDGKPAAEELTEKGANETDKAPLFEPMDILSEIKTATAPKDPDLLPIFGMDIFEKAEYFQPLMGAAVPDSYVVGQGDSFSVSIWGRFDAQYALTVDNEGKVQFPKVGPVRLGGLTYKEASDLLKSKAESITGVNAAVTLAGTRTIQVFVVGEARTPGAHLLSPMSTVIHAVIAAGGPTDLGSLRTITLRRNGRESAKLDFYDFILGGEVAGDRLLDNGDTIVIPRGESKVGLFGKVKRPAVYELRRGEGLLELINYAGGLRPDAYGGRIQVKRSHNNLTRLVLDVPFIEIKGQFILQDGDAVQVFPLKPAFENRVAIYGHAYATGEYSLEDGARISDVVGSFESLKPEAELSYAVILREVGPNRSKTVISFNLGEALSDSASEENKLLAPNDEIYIFSKYQFIEPLQASVDGQVRNPGLYRFEQGARVADLVRLAGGLTGEALFDRAEIERVLEDRSLATYEVNLLKALKGDPSHNIEIMNGDRLIVHSIKEPAPDRVVSCLGEVNHPGQYPLTEKMRISDLIFKAGDLTKDAYLGEVHVYRTDHATKEKHFAKINLKNALEGAAEDNILLADLDEVFIYSAKALALEETAIIKGEVKNPAEYPIAAGMRVADLVLKAGGPGKDAYMNEAHVYRTHPKTKDVFIKVFNLGKVLGGDLEENFLLQDGDEIAVHSTYEINPRQTVYAAGKLNNPETYEYASNMRVRDLVVAAGGLSEDAYLSEAEVVRSEVHDGEIVQVKTIRINLGRAMAGEKDANIAIKPYDKLFVKAIPEWRETWKIQVKGEVPFPGIYYIAKGERLSSVIERAGGYTPDAYLRGAVFSRESARELQQKRFDELRNRLHEAILRVSSQEVQSALSSEDARVQEQYLAAQQALLKKLESIRATGRVVVKLLPLEGLAGSEWDVVLEDGDIVDIPKIPQVVNVVGEVYNPTSLLWEPDNQMVAHYLNKTGGPTNDAEEKEIYVVRADGTVVSRNSLGRNNWWSTGIEDLYLYPGDTILVPPRVLRVSFMKEVSNITQTLYQIAVTAGVVVAIL